MISGAHVIVYSKDAEADRAFFRDVLGIKSVDAGEGWLIFALPPGEAARLSASRQTLHASADPPPSTPRTRSALPPRDEAKHIPSFSRRTCRLPNYAEPFSNAATGGDRAVFSFGIIRGLPGRPTGCHPAGIVLA